MSENYEPALDGIDLAKLEALGWQIALCPVCGMSAAAFKPDSRIADLARLTAELERKQRECEGLRELIERWMAYGIWQRERGAPFPQPLFDDTEAALSAGEKDHVPDA